jgi:hypothetical protein
MKKILVVGVLALSIVGSGLEASSDPEVSSTPMVSWDGRETFDEWGTEYVRSREAQMEIYALWLGNSFTVSADDIDGDSDWYIDGYRKAFKINSDFRLALRKGNVTQVQIFIKGSDAEALMRIFWYYAPHCRYLLRGTLARELRTLRAAGYDFNIVLPWKLHYAPIPHTLSPLAMAASVDDRYLVKALLVAGAKSDFQLKDGSTAIDHVNLKNKSFEDQEYDVKQMRSLLKGEKTDPWYLFGFLGDA